MAWPKARTNDLPLALGQCRLDGLWHMFRTTGRSPRKTSLIKRFLLKIP